MSQKPAAVWSKNAIQGAAGAAAACGAHFLTYPLYNLTIRMQARQASTRSELIKKVLSEEGIAGFFNGALSSIVATTLQSAFYYYFFAAFKSFHNLSGKHSPTGSLITAAEAGVMAVLCINPLFDINTAQVLSPKEKRLGFVAALQHILKTEGVAGLYKGLIPSLFLVSTPMAQFYFYELLIRVVSGIQGSTHEVAQELMSPLANFALGASSKALATVVTFPIQTVRTLSARGVDGDGRKDDGAKARRSYTAKLLSLWSQVVAIMRNEGPMGLYRGFETKVVQSSLSAAVLFVIRLQLLSSLKPRQADE